MPGPSFVVILTDDQAYGDLGCMGATDLATPHLDALAAQGALLTSWYSNSPVCSPSRASLMTGRYPGNAGVRSILTGHRTASGLHPSVPTVATALRTLGYRTALFGKWHLGLAEGSRPHDHGFEEWFGFMAGCVDYYSHIHHWTEGLEGVHDLWDNGREVWRNGQYFTEMVTERAVDYIERVAARDDPFFLYLPYSAPHYPMHAPAKYVDRFPGLSPDRRIMAAMLAALDDGVGEVVETLRRVDRFEDTFVFFQSDNGPSREIANWLDGRTDPYYGGGCTLKGHKFSLYEGGIRSPALACWPTRIPAGQTIAEVGIAMDMFPTVVRAAGGDPRAYELDGREVLAMLADRAASPHDDIFWEMGRQTAVRRGRWKLVLHGQLVEGAPPDDDVFLADLESDPGERVNLREKQPELVAELREAGTSWRQSIEDRWEKEWRPLLAEVGTTSWR
ncbi:MAG: sulfatase [Chloroflexi bacterium]|nr:MAG: sulfatase [Chloroflexota bacterium]